MSDESNEPSAPQPPKPPTPPTPPTPPAKPTAKTSSVPLKKETVRITLRAKPGEGGDVPAAPARPSAPAPPTGSKTIPLSPKPTAPGAAPAGKQTVQLRTGPGAPGATTPLQRTQPVTSAPPTAAVGSAKFQTSSFEADEEDEPAGMTAVGVAALVLSFILLIIMMMGSDKVDIFVKKGDSGTPAWGVPEPNNPSWETPQPDGTFRPSFDQRLPEIPTRSSN